MIPVKYKPMIQRTHSLAETGTTVEEYGPDTARRSLH